MLFVLRVLLLLIAASVAQRMIRGFLRLLASQVSRPVSRSHGPVIREDEKANATVLQQDPICGTYVAVDSSLKRLVNGRVVHFCSSECRDRYVVPA